MTNIREKIQSILPEISANSELAEKQCSLPEKNIELLAEAGLFKILLPNAYGGIDVPLTEYTECLVDIAEACASTAWVSGLLANHSHGIALFDKRLQDEIWGDSPNTLVSSSVAPLGQWEKADGGITLSGRFGFSSGCDHASWAILGYMGKNDMGQPGPCFAVVPREDYTILNDWDTAALRGTGSKSIVLENVFVPNYRSESLFSLNYGLSKGYQLHPDKIHTLPFSSVFSLGFSAVALGIARRMTSVFKEKTVNRVRAYTGAKVAESAPAYMRLAESVNQTNAALELLRHDWRQMEAASVSQELPSAECMLYWRVNQSYATKMAVEAVDRVFSAAGGGAWFNTNEMQRLFRDAHICASHAQTDYDMAAQTFGRHLIGLSADAKYY